MIPAYMSSFSCLMGECKHTCCAGWEIDIDQETFHRYQHVPGEIGAKLKEKIVVIDGQPQFKLDEEDRCPFLKRDGLCELILTLGESSLCQICTDHPRFRNAFSDRVEEGLGLCCEAAAKLILEWKEPFQLLKTQDDGATETLSEEEEKLLLERDRLICIMQNRSLTVEERIKAMLSRHGMKLNEDAEALQAFLLRLERLDEAWTERIELLCNHADLSDTEAFELPFEQLVVYLLYRHLPATLDDEMFRESVYYTALIWWLLRKLLAVSVHQNIEELAEICRFYSSEIEYSDENIYAILDDLTLRI